MVSVLGRSQEQAGSHIVGIKIKDDGTSLWVVDVKAIIWGLRGSGVISMNVLTLSGEEINRPLLPNRFPS